ncbi:hypothetical protein M378DRAFT_732588 [Amanita muscaria Koide BX008]|uniref:Crinkler effector protein N-terminal domain-containing protein n=1 Tax=Amanita muscaria (strain Koide BX008) TaxID=946122 RepID=A0A0C2T8U9_AMAMK|nr:hypothetical protein M378DRAFT_732588 [Amanita muscaria Koide BX008]
MDFSLSDLSQSDNEFSLFCCVFSTLDAPFSVRIEKHKIVDELKQTIKKEKEHAFAEIDFNVLDIWKVSGRSWCELMKRSDIREAVSTNPFF